MSLLFLPSSTKDTIMILAKLVTVVPRAWLGLIIMVNRNTCTAIQWTNNIDMSCCHTFSGLAIAAWYMTARRGSATAGTWQGAPRPPLSPASPTSHQAAPGDVLPRTMWICTERCVHGEEAILILIFFYHLSALQPCAGSLERIFASFAALGERRRGVLSLTRFPCSLRVGCP